jgi:hypothetical protein
MQTSDILALAAILISLLALRDSRQTERNLRRQYAAEKREEALVLAEMLKSELEAALSIQSQLLLESSYLLSSETIVGISENKKRYTRLLEKVTELIERLKRPHLLDRDDPAFWLELHRDFRAVTAEAALLKASANSSLEAVAELRATIRKKEE